MGFSQRGNIWLLAALFGFLLIVGADMWTQRSRRPPDVREGEARRAFLDSWKPPLPIGSVAPGFRLKDRNGKVHTLSEFRGKPTLLDFYTDDSRSRFWAEQMTKLRNHVGRNGIRSVAVVSFSREAARAFQRDTGDDSVYLFEAPDHHPVRDRYHAAPGPNAWVLSRSGKIVHASAPITTDKHPDLDFQGVYQALQPLVLLDLPQDHEGEGAPILPTDPRHNPMAKELPPWATGDEPSKPRKD